MLTRLYTRQNILTGMLIYGIGDGVAALISGEFLWVRMIGMSMVGALLYSVEIPHYFRWVATKAQLYPPLKATMLRTLLAMLYFNPLWIARHLLFIRWFSNDVVDSDLVILALQSFLTALPLTVAANFFIQNVIRLPQRFAASALFSCLMAIIYPLLERYFKGS